MQLEKLTQANRNRTGRLERKRRVDDRLPTDQPSVSWPGGQCWLTVRTERRTPGVAGLSLAAGPHGHSGATAEHRLPDQACSRRSTGPTRIRKALQEHSKRTAASAESFGVLGDPQMNLFAYHLHKPFVTAELFKSNKRFAETAIL